MAAPLAERDRHATELMDDPGCDLATLERTYARFALVNAVVAGWQLTYRRFVRPVLHPDRTTTVLDIGCGGGDLARALARWAQRGGHRLEVTGVDPDPRAHAWATRQAPVAGVTFERALSSDLVAQGRSFDLVVSNHVLHHLGAEEFHGLLADSAQLARTRALHSDIARSRWAYRAFSAASRAVTAGSFIREDGLTSIRRSWTAPELRAVAPAGWRVERPWPARTLLVHDAGRP